MIQRMRKAQEGFTLIELVVVVAILGILAVIVTPKVLGAMDNAKTNGVASSGKQIQVGLERMYAEKGAYPLASAVCSSTTASPCTADQLVAALGSYVNLDAGNFDKDTPPTYELSTDKSTYELVIAFNGGKVATITPNSVTVK